MARKSQKISIYRIAEEAGVSVPTVSRVINRKAGIAEETRNKINNLLKHYNFRPDYPAMRTTKIAVIYPWNYLSNYFRKAIMGIYDYAQENELMINIIIVQSLHKESLLKAIRDQQCSGVIGMLTEQYYQDFIQLADTDLPTVMLGTPPDNNKIGFIYNDSYSGSAAAARHLIELGHRKIGYLTYAESKVSQLQRFKGALNAFEDSNITLDSKAIIQIPRPSIRPVPGECGYKAMQALLRQTPEITAVMAVDDNIALGAMAAIYEAGLRIPEDISIVGFDNYPETAYWSPALTTVDYPLGKAGYMAAKAVHEKLICPGECQLPQEILPAKLVVRRSTGSAVHR